MSLNSSSFVLFGETISALVTNNDYSYTSRAWILKNGATVADILINAGSGLATHNIYLIRASFSNNAWSYASTKVPSRQEFNTLGAIETKDATNVTLPNATFVTLTSMTLSPGTYILTGNVNFDQNTSGIRITMIDTEETSQNGQTNSTLATGRATLEYVRIISISSQTTIYLRAYQNSGATMNGVSAVLKTMKIK